MAAKWHKPEISQAAPSVPPGGNGVKAAPKPRRHNDPHDFDGTRLRQYDGNGDGYGAKIQITLVGLFGLIVSVLGTGATMLTFGQGQIDRSIKPISDQHVRIEREIDSLDRDVNIIFRSYVPREERLRMVDEINQRLDDLRQGIRASAAQDLAAIESRAQLIEELAALRRRVLALENKDR